MARKIVEQKKVLGLKDIALAAVRAHDGITMDEVCTITFTDVQGARALLKDLEIEGYIKHFDLECRGKLVYFARPWCMDCGCTNEAPCIVAGKPCEWGVTPGEAPSEFGQWVGICTNCQ